jgi:hypothetical protein
LESRISRVLVSAGLQAGHASTPRVVPASRAGGRFLFDES